MKNGFTYGIVQWILNETLMNMLIMERWDAYLEPIRKCLHVPVSSICMKAALDELKIAVHLSSGGYGNFNISNDELCSKSDIRWNYNDYIKFQNDVRNAVLCPIDWVYSIRSKATSNNE